MKRVQTGNNPPRTTARRPSHHTSVLPRVVPMLMIGKARSSRTNATVSTLSFLSTMTPSADNECDRRDAGEHRDDDGPRHGQAQHGAFLTLDAGDAGAQHDVGRRDRVAVRATR